MSRKLITGLILGILLLVGGGGYLVANPRVVFDRETIKKSPVLLALRNVKLSLIKLPDLMHLSYWFHQTELTTYTLELSRKDIAKLDEHLPRDIYDGKLLDDNKFQVKGYFKAPGYEDANVKVRYRGFGSNHWNARQRSYLVEFPKDHLYQGMKSLALIIAYDRGYYADRLAAERAKQAGLHMPDPSFVRLKFNGEGNGVYLAVEQWSNNWLAHEGLAENASIYTTIKTADESLHDEQSLLRAVGQKYWKDYTKNTDQEPLQNLAALVEKADNATFARELPDILDMEAFYSWARINILAGSFHQSDGTMILLFNRVTGKFEPIPWDVNHYWINQDYFHDTDTLTKRILAIPEFYKIFRASVLAYVNNPIKLQADLAFYDELANKMRPEFYSDRVKFHNDRTFDFLTARTRQQIIDNFAKIPALLPEKSPVVFAAPSGKGFALTGSFLLLPKVSAGAAQLVAIDPRFQLVNGQLQLAPGSYNFNSDVIVPKGTVLVIAAGTQLTFAPGVSLVSYSPVIARGTAAAPITFSRRDPAGHWGVVAVANTGERESEFSYTYFDGGSSSVPINGVLFTGMLAAHTAPVKITNARFTNDGDDDAVNIKYSSGIVSHSYFANNNGDALDMDESSGVVVDSNIFNNNGLGIVPGHATIGDSIDISFNHSLIKNNIITNCGDKGISIGENSSPQVLNNVIINCDYGIAVKDNSHATLIGDIILNNKRGLGLYVKKPEFAGGGHFIAEHLTLWGNGHSLEADDQSSYSIKNSVVEGGLTGDNISSTKPDFRQLLPAALWPTVKNYLQ